MAKEMKPPAKVGDYVKSGSARGVIIRVERYQKPHEPAREDIYVDWKVG